MYESPGWSKLDKNNHKHKTRFADFWTGLLRLLVMRSLS